MRRPEICNVKTQYSRVKGTMSLESWYKLNKKCCSILQSKMLLRGNNLTSEIIKPKGWSPPNITEEIQRQMREGSF